MHICRIGFDLRVSLTYVLLFRKGRGSEFLYIYLFKRKSNAIQRSNNENHSFDGKSGVSCI
jgi:hypothetical protein